MGGCQLPPLFGLLPQYRHQRTMVGPGLQEVAHAAHAAAGHEVEHVQRRRRQAGPALPLPAVHHRRQHCQVSAEARLGAVE